MAHSNEELMQAYQSGDLKAYETLYQRNASKLYGYLKLKLQPGDVDDVFQLIWLKLHRARHQYNPQYLFEQWLFVVARSVLLDYVKQQRRQPRGDHDPKALEKIEAPVSQIEDHPSYSEIEGVVQSLPEEQRKVIQMRVLDEFTYEEIAHALSRSEVSVRQIFSRAIKKIRNRRYPRYE